MHTAQLQLYSYGKVAEVPALGQSTIRIMLTERSMSSVDDVVYKNETVDAEFNTFGGKDTVTVDNTNTVPAKWIKLNSNRVTPPNVRRDDNVLVWRLGNTDKYFWMDLNDCNIKRLETVLYAFSADPNNPIAEDFSNCYYIEISAHGKSITLHTSQANGEAFGYDIQLDTEASKLTILDTALNEIFLDSANTTIGARNANTTRILLAKKNINMFAPDSISLEAKNLMAFKCTDFKIDASNSYSLDTKTITINSKTYTSTSDSNKFNCPKSTFTGSVNIGENCSVGKNLSVGGNISAGAGRSKGGGGNCNISGGLKCNKADVSGAITCGSIKAGSGNFGSLKHGGGKCC